MTCNQCPFDGKYGHLPTCTEYNLSDPYYDRPSPPAEPKCDCGHRMSNHAKNAFDGLTCTMCGCADAPPLDRPPTTEPAERELYEHVKSDAWYDKAKSFGRLEPKFPTEPAESAGKAFCGCAPNTVGHKPPCKLARSTAPPAETTEHAKAFADAAIAKCRESAYGPGNWANEGEGDYGSWDDWRDVIASTAEQYATKQIERFVEEVEKEVNINGLDKRADDAGRIWRSFKAVQEKI